MKTPAENPIFIALIRAAQSNHEFKNRLLTILSLGEKDRHGLLKSFAEELTLKEHAPDIVDAVLCLTTDSISETTIKAIQAHFRQDLSVTMPWWYALLSTAGGIIGFIVGWGVIHFSIFENEPLFDWLLDTGLRATLSSILLLTFVFTVAFLGAQVVDRTVGEIIRRTKV